MIQLILFFQLITSAQICYMDSNNVTCHVRPTYQDLMPLPSLDEVSPNADVRAAYVAFTSCRMQAWKGTFVWKQSIIDCSDLKEAIRQVETIDIPAIQTMDKVKAIPRDCHKDEVTTSSTCYDTVFIDDGYSCSDKARGLWHDENNPPNYWCRRPQQ